MNELKFYKTLSTSSQAEFKDRGSKFIAIAARVNTLDDVETALAELRKTYHDARHHCYAYRLGIEGEKTRANDDGEPNHSAGDPILGQIRSFDLTYTLVVVIRYFGGTKLGVSGLINAYRSAAEEALAQAKIIEVPVTTAFRLNYPYESTNEVMRLLSEFDAKVVSQEFTERCVQEIAVNVAHKVAFQDKVLLLQQTGTSIDID